MLVFISYKTFGYLIARQSQRAVHFEKPSCKVKQMYIHRVQLNLKAVFNLKTVKTGCDIIENIRNNKLLSG